MVMESVFSYIAESPGQLLLVFGAVLISTYLLYQQCDNHYSGRKLPPALKSLPIVGSLPFLPRTVQDLAKFGISPRNKLGKIFSFYFGSR